MRKIALVAAAVTAIVVGTASPALASTGHSEPKPKAPTAVRVAAHGTTAAQVSWAPPKKSRPSVTSFTVTVSPSTGLAHHGVESVGSHTHAATVAGLKAGTTYSFAVRSASTKATSSPVTAKYTVPKAAAAPAGPSLFALSSAGSLVRFPLVNGTASSKSVVVAANGAGYAADAHADAFVPSAGAIVEYPASGASKTLASGLHLTADLHADARGDLFWFDSVTGNVDELAAGAKTATAVIAAPASTSVPPQLAVGSDGTVSAVSDTDQGVVITTRKPCGTVSTRTIADTDYLYPVAAVADGSGTVYLALQTSGASGSLFWAGVAAGSWTLTGIDPHEAYDYAAVNATTFSLLQSNGWCAGASEGMGTCTPDRSVTQLLTSTPTVGSKSVPMSGLTTGGQYSRGLRVGAADTAGDVFVNVPDGSTAGLREVPAAGGAAKLISGAQFSRLSVG
jgi:hypothetical protein